MSGATMPRKRKYELPNPIPCAVGSYEPPAGVDVSTLSKSEKAKLWGLLPSEMKTAMPSLVELRDAFEGELWVSI
jgi:hypothetical protein